MMQAREARGLQLSSAAQPRSEGVWLVPSQTTSKIYTVDLNSIPPVCDCPDHKEHDFKCKHVFAAEYAARAVQGEPLPPAPEIVKRRYKQEWPAYCQAQVNEKAKFQELLFDLCKGIAEPVQATGRPRMPIADSLFAIGQKVYEGMSGRRSQTDMREALQRGYLSRPVHYNTISKYLERPELTPYLKGLIVESSLPLKGVERNFALDSSGFSVGRTDRWLDTKWNRARQANGQPVYNCADWLKAHVMCGCKTNIIVAAEVTEGSAGDSPQFRPLVETAARNFDMETVVADKAYSSKRNLQLVVSKSATPYIPFKSNTTATDPRQSELWRRLYHYYMMNQEEFMAHYHLRSNAETTFSMVKAKFRERLRSRTRTAQTNELLAKLLCHNVCCVIQSIYELGIEVNFSAE